MHQMERQLLPDVVVGKGTGVLKHLARDYEWFLVRQDFLLVVNPSLHHLERLRRFHLWNAYLARVYEAWLWSNCSASLNPFAPVVHAI